MSYAIYKQSDKSLERQIRYWRVKYYLMLLVVIGLSVFIYGVKLALEGL
jgi:hypothetical protein